MKAKIACRPLERNIFTNKMISMRCSTLTCMILRNSNIINDNEKDKCSRFLKYDSENCFKIHQHLCRIEKHDNSDIYYIKSIAVKFNYVHI